MHRQHRLRRRLQVEEHLQLHLLSSRRLLLSNKRLLLYKHHRLYQHRRVTFPYVLCGLEMLPVPVIRVEFILSAVW